MAEAWCAQQTWQVKLVRVKLRATKLLTPQPQLHAADEPMRMARVAAREKVLRADIGEKVAANGFDAKKKDTRAQCPRRHGHLPVVPAEQEVTEIDVDGPAAAQPRDASQERAKRCNYIPTELKSAIERVHVNLGQSPLPALIRTLRLGNATVAAIRAVRSMPKSAEAQDSKTKSTAKGRRAQCVACS